MTRLAQDYKKKFGCLIGFDPWFEPLNQRLDQKIIIPTLFLATDQFVNRRPKNQKYADQIMNYLLDNEKSLYKYIKNTSHQQVI